MDIRFFFALLTFALALAARVHAEATNFLGERWKFLDVGQTLRAAREITTAKYPDCDEATVDKKLVRVYRADGTGESQDEAFVKVLTEKGKRNNRSLSLYYMLP